MHKNFYIHAWAHAPNNVFSHTVMLYFKVNTNYYSSGWSLPCAEGVDILILVWVPGWSQREFFFGVDIELLTLPPDRLHVIPILHMKLAESGFLTPHLARLG